MKPTFDPRLYYVHDFATNSSLEALKAALRGGARMIQFRAKPLTSAQAREWIAPQMGDVRAARATAIINDDIELAAVLGADGVHLGPTDTSIRQARERLGPDAILGLSLEAGQDLNSQAIADADYVAASGVFPTPTKSDLSAHFGLEGLRALRARTALPLIAIGGVHAGNARDVFAAGADGVAVISAIARAAEPQLAACELGEIARASAIRDGHGRMRFYDPRALTVAGSDSGAGAGIQADLKTMTALGVYGASVLTALTAQNTLGVQAVAAVDPDFVRAQLRSVLGDLGADGIKIGMLHRREIIEAVAEELRELTTSPLVLDPVMVAKGGHRLIDPAAIQSMIGNLFPRATLITPNLSEASAILEAATPTWTKGLDLTSASPEVLRRAAFALLELGPGAVLLKGGHHASTHAEDLLVTRSGEEKWFRSPRTDTNNLHGTGCTLSSAIAAFMARGFPLTTSVAKAKDYVTGAISSGSRFRWGSGQGPVDHIHLHR